MRNARGFVPSRFIICVVLSVSLVVSLIPFDSPVSNENADAFVPAAGAAVAAGAALGLSDVAVVLGAIGMVSLGVGMTWSTQEMMQHVQDGVMDETAYASDAVDWREHGINVPSWGDLTNTQQGEFNGSAWQYDSAIWMKMMMDLYGMDLSDLGGGGDDPDPNQNKKWNFLKAFATSGAVVPMADTALILGSAMFSSLFGSNGENMGIMPVNQGTLNGKPWWTARFSYPSATGILDNGQTFTTQVILPDKWSYMIKLEEYRGAIKELDWIGFIVPTDTNYYNFIFTENTNGYKFYRYERIGSSNPTERIYVYDESQDQFYERSADLGVTWQSLNNLNVGRNVISENGTTSIYDVYLNADYVGQYKIYSGGTLANTFYKGSSSNYQVGNSVLYGQLSDFPSQLANAIYNADNQAYQQGLAEMQPETQGNELVVTNPYASGATSVDWQDFVQEETEGSAQPLPDETPTDQPYPTPEEQPTQPDYANRIERILELAFSNVFPFCLINDIRLLSNRVVMAGGQADFSVDIPLDSFGLQNVSVITLDANHPETGGGLIEVGNMTRPFFNILLVALLLGFSIKLFLR